MQNHYKEKITNHKEMPNNKVMLNIQKQQQQQQRHAHVKPSLFCYVVLHFQAFLPTS